MKTDHGRTVILSVFLLAVIASGIPQIEIHTHQNAYFGHEHGVSHHHDDHDNVSPDDVDGLGNSGTTHAHDLGVSAVTLLFAADLNILVHRHSNGGIPPPTARPPDNPTPPLYRPPIV